VNFEATKRLSDMSLIPEYKHVKGVKCGICVQAKQPRKPFHTVEVGLGIRSIRVIRFGLFGFVKFRVLKNENRNFQKYFRNRTQIDSQFRFGLFGPPNRPEL
jgi:hypothetical protein